MLKVPFYTKTNCSLCEDAYALLMMLKSDYPFEVEERDIYSNDAWLEEYQLLIPAVKINNILLTCEEMSLEQLEEAMKKHFNKT